MSLRGVAGGCGPGKIIMFYYTYVLQSTLDKRFYIGFINNLRKRFLKHQNGEVPATKKRRPLKIIYYEACLNKEKAVKREKYFKTGFGRRFLKARIYSW